ncbi:MAG: oligosaccharide flippase family protein [Mesorhizobium sp.]
MKRFFKQGSFARGAFTLMTGTAVAQAVAIAISPILTRLYSPSDFGIFALFIALVTFLSTAATGRYELAIILPENEDDADALVILSTAIATGFGLLLLVALLATHGWAAAMLGHPEIDRWLFLVPVSVFLTGCYNALNYWLNRHGQYQRMSINRMLQSGLGGGLQLSLGFSAWGTAAGLILGQFIAVVLTTAQIAVTFFRSCRLRDLKKLKTRMRHLALRYRSHPAHLLPAHLIGAAAMQLPVLAISGLYGPTTVGLYALAYRVMVMPTTLIANAIGDVYRQRATVLHREQGDFRRLFLITLATSTALAAAPVGIIVVIAPDLFAFVFGEPWRVAGDYARLLAIATLFQFALTPIDKGALIVGATRYIMAWNMIRLVCFAGVVVAAWAFDLPFKQTLILFVAANVGVYVLDGMVEYRLASPRLTKP